MKVSVPFYVNPDTTHCYQACLRMILRYFEPDQDYSWEELDQITAKAKDMWTWPMAGQLWLVDHGFEVRIVESFDYRRFLDEGEAYLVELGGKEVAAKQIANSKIEQEYEYARQLLERVPIETRIPVVSEVCSWLDEGALVICNVNSRTLNGSEGFSGHFVVVIGYTDDELVIHDPGGSQPGEANRVVSKALFEKAWAYPDEKSKEYFIVKK